MNILIGQVNFRPDPFSHWVAQALDFMTQFQVTSGTDQYIFEFYSFFFSLDTIHYVFTVQIQAKMSPTFKLNKCSLPPDLPKSGLVVTSIREEPERIS